LFICVSDFIHRTALEKGYPREKLRTHYIGVDRAVFTPTGRPANNQILFVGRLVAKKGCSYLLRSMELFQRAVPTATLVIVGDGPLRQSLQREADRLQLRRSFVGAQSTPAIKKLLSESTLLCLPSVIAEDGDTEGLGMVALEAHAAGRPVVAFKTGGIPEAVRDTVTGLLSASGDIVSLAQNITTFLQDEKFWNTASREAVDWVRRRFDLNTQTAELEQIYQKVAAGQPLN
jgi:glycosyltransferase involved in cell wall biosynthesis